MSGVFFRAPCIRVFKPVGFEGRRRPAMQQYVLDNGFTAKAGTMTTDAAGNATCSHYMYGGLYAMGKLEVPQGVATEALAAAVVTDFCMRRFGALTENKPAGKPMRFYADIDLVTKTQVAEAHWDVLEGIILAEVKRFFPAVPASDPLFDALVLASGTRDVTLPDGTPGSKAGVHVVFQNLFVDVDMALYLSSAIIARVQKTWPDTSDADVATALHKCVDQAVYGKTRGLRWAWQFKAMTCPRCATTTPEGKLQPNRKGCVHCYAGTVADVSSSMYAPVYYVNGDAVRTVLPDCRDAPTVELLLAASIRYVDGVGLSDGFVVYEGAPPRPVLRVVGRKAENSVQVCTDAGEPAKTAKADMLVRGSLEVNALQAAVRRVHAMYADIDVKYAHRAANRHWYKVFVRNAGASYCLNVAKDHSHAQVLFLVKRTGVQQVCQCRCDTTVNRLSGKRCRDYMSPLHALLASELTVLFPTTTESSTFFPASVTAVSTVVAAELEAAKTARALPVSAACFSPEERQARLMTRVSAATFAHFFKTATSHR